MDKQKIFSFVKESNVFELLDMPQTMLSDIFGEEFSDMKGYWQNNPHHCYDLLEHTVRTVDSMDCSGLSEREITELKIAALYHDVGKPKVAFEKNGRTVFYNHAAESRKIAEKELLCAGLKQGLVDRICFYIEHHDDFISFKPKAEVVDCQNPFIKPITIKDIYEKIRSAQIECKKKGSYIPAISDYVLLMRLCFADVKAQNSEVILDDVLIDTLESKLSRIGDISKILNLISNADKDHCDLHI